MATDETKGEDEWPSERAAYELIEMVGMGAFAKVYKARCIPKNCLVAVKILELEKLGSGIDEVRTEVATMKMCKHENVLPCHCCFSDDATLWVVMPYMDRGSCFHLLSSLKANGRIKDGEGISEELIAIILREALQGLEYLHDNAHIHRDIKAGNILLDSKGSVRIADFGVSGWLMEKGDRREKADTFVGTPCWMAPEVMEQLGGYNTKADIWSFGITMLELAKGFAPYAKHPPIKVMLKTLQEDPPSLKTYKTVPGQRFSRHFKEVVQLCLQRDPKRRPSCHSLLSKRFFSHAGSIDKLANFLVSVPELKDIPGVTRPAGMGRVQVDVGKVGYVVTDDGGAVNRVKGTTWDFGSMVLTQKGEGEEVSVEQLAEVLNQIGEFNGEKSGAGGDSASVMSPTPGSAATAPDLTPPAAAPDAAAPVAPEVAAPAAPQVAAPAAPQAAAPANPAAAEPVTTAPEPAAVPAPAAEAPAPDAPASAEAPVAAAPVATDAPAAAEATVADAAAAAPAEQ